jgi:meso-butanediol dehydrogenase/(S,S)-butanediol dehydrogenase/diacetyl reductase
MVAEQSTGRPLSNRTVLVTGAAGGIGMSVSRRLLADGAQLLLTDLDGEAVERLGSELGQLAVQADLTLEADLDRVVNEAYRRWGRLDVLFNNAGVIRVQPLLEVTGAEWDRIIAVNLRAAFFVLQSVARRMATQELISGSELRGKLIQTASIAAYRGGSGLVAPYAASKAGVVSITRSAAQALAPLRITSNCICPGVVETPLWIQIDREWGAIEGWEPGEAWQRRIASIPLGRGEQPKDVAGVITFLAGPDSDYITGQAINVDGGIVMGN